MLERLSDNELMQAAAADDRHAFRELLDRYSGRIVGFLYRFLGDRDRALDLAQETFIRLYRRLRSSTPARAGEGSCRSLIFTIAANLGRDELRRRSVRREVSLDALPPGSRAPGPTPDVLVEKREEQERAQAALARLPADRSAWDELPRDLGLLARTELTPDQRRYVAHLKAGRVRGSRHGGVRRRSWSPRSNPGGWLVKLKGTVDFQPLGTPAYLDGSVFIGGGLNSRVVYTFDARRGKLEWARELADNGPSNPARWGNLCFAVRGDTLETVDLVTGRRKWVVTLEGGGQGIAMPGQGSSYLSPTDPCVAGGTT